MGIDMFLYVFGISDGGPVVLPVLAWSHGASTSLDAISPPPRLPSTGPLSSSWDVAAVEKWVSGVAPGFEAAFGTHLIDGTALLALGESDLTALVPQIGPRRRLEVAIGTLRQKEAEAQAEAQTSSDSLNLQDLSVTLWSGTATCLALQAPLLARRTLPRVVLVGFSGSGRRRRYGGDDDDPSAPPQGTPLFCNSLTQVIVSSWSSGGSGGEDRLTVNVSLSAATFSFATLGVFDHKDLSWPVHARILKGVDPRDPDWDPETSTLSTLERAPGVLITYDRVAKRCR